MNVFFFFLTMALVKSCCVQTRYTLRNYLPNAHLLETFEPVSSRKKATVGDYTIFYFDLRVYELFV